MIMSNERCPFQIGDIVVYRPTLKGRGSIIMTDLSALKHGEKYKVARIDEGLYVVLEGFENAVGGGLYWTEFAPS